MTIHAFVRAELYRCCCGCGAGEGEFLRLLVVMCARLVVGVGVCVVWVVVCVGHVVWVLWVGRRMRMWAVEGGG